MIKRFSVTGNINLEEKFLQIATFLDPRFKDKFLKNKTQVNDDIIDELVQNDEAESTLKVETRAEKSPPKEGGEENVQLGQEIHEDFWACFDEMKADSDSSMDSSASVQGDRKRNPSNRQKKTFYQAELDKYMALPLIGRSEDPILWWKTNMASFMPLKKIVLKYLSAPPSSVASERQFSTAGNVCTDTRNRLLPENADRLVFIIKNKQLLKKT